MSYDLKVGGLKEVNVSNYLPANIIELGEYSIEMKDFFNMVIYLLTNSNLMNNDPRIKFIEEVKGMKIGPGFETIVAGKEQSVKRILRS